MNRSNCVLSDYLLHSSSWTDSSRRAKWQRRGRSPPPWWLRRASEARRRWWPSSNSNRITLHSKPYRNTVRHYVMTALDQCWCIITYSAGVCLGGSWPRYWAPPKGYKIYLRIHLPSAPHGPSWCWWGTLQRSSTSRSRSLSGCAPAVWSSPLHLWFHTGEALQQLESAPGTDVSAACQTCVK